MAACSSWGSSGRNVAGWRPTSRQGEGRGAAHRRTRGPTPEQALAAGPPAPICSPAPRARVVPDGPPAICRTSVALPQRGVIKASAPRPRALGKLAISCGLFRLSVLLLQAGGTPITSPAAPQWRPAAARRGSHFCLWPVLEEGAPCGEKPGQDTSHPVSLCP